MQKSKNEQKHLDQFNNLTEKNQKMKDLHSQLIIEEHKIISQQEALNDQLNDINKKIAFYNDKIEIILTDESGTNILSNNNIEKKCLENFNNFFIVKENNLKDIIYEFQIKYFQTVFRKHLENESMTFLDLKKEMKYQIGISENEFFFCDKNQHIFLDEFKIKDVLFPFGKIVLKNNYPILQIIQNSSDEEIFIDMEKIEKEKLILEDQNNIQDNIENDFIQNFKRIFIGSIYYFIFLVFLISWISAIFELRDVPNYFLMYYSFTFKKMLNLNNSKGNILTEIRDFYADLFNFPPQNSSFKDYQDNLNCILLNKINFDIIY